MNEVPKIGRSTHEPLQNNYQALIDSTGKASLDKILLPTVRRNGRSKRDTFTHTRVIFKPGYTETVDPDVFIEHTNLNASQEAPTRVGENSLWVWTNKDGSARYDYQINLGLELEPETASLLSCVDSHLSIDILRELEADIVDPYTFAVTPEGISLTTKMYGGGTLFSLDEEGYEVHVENPPLPNAGWTGNPPQRLTDNERGISYEFIVAILPISPEIASKHYVKYGTELSDSVTIYNGIHIAADSFWYIKEEVDELVLGGLTHDVEIRKMINPYIRYMSGSIVDL